MKHFSSPPNLIFRCKYRPRPTVWHSINPFRVAIALVFLVSCTFAGFLQSSNARAVGSVTNCADVQFIFARGSGEPLGGPSASAWKSSLENVLTDSNLSYNFYELGSQSVGGYQYPAVTVSDGLNGYANLIGAYVSGGGAFDFGASVRQGQGELKALTRQISAACPSTKFVLGGYSQGAMLISGILDQLDSSKIIYVATFGDPKLYLPEGEQRHDHTSRQPATYRQVPDACLGKNLSPYREHVPDCYAYEGVLGSYRPYQPSGYAGKLGTWCNDRDIMCSSGYSLSDHTSYVSAKLYAEAAQVITAKLIAAFPRHVIITTNTETAAHNVAILIDSSGSMSTLINHYKGEAKNLAERVLTQGGQVALFEYRDLDDPFETKMLCDFSCTLEQFASRIDSITVDGGGDDPESALSALLYAMNSLDWKSGATKSIVLLTDARYLSPDRDGTTLQEVVLRSLEIDPVNIYTITPPTRQSAYAELTSLTNGRTFSSTSDLRISTDAILGRPVAKLALAEYSGMIGDEFYFDASKSYDEGGGELSFDWDLDGDGIFEFPSSASTITKSYSQAFSSYIQVRVRQGDLSSTMSAKLTVTPRGEIVLPTISELVVEPTSENAALIRFRSDADKVFLTIGDAPYGFLSDGRREFIINDLPSAIQITLTPYDVSGRKGISSSASIDPTIPAASTSPATTLPTVPNTGLRN